MEVIHSAYNQYSVCFMSSSFLMLATKNKLISWQSDGLEPNPRNHAVVRTRGLASAALPNYISCYSRPYFPHCCCPHPAPAPNFYYFSFTLNHKITSWNMPTTLLPQGLWSCCWCCLVHFPQITALHHSGLKTEVKSSKAPSLNTQFERATAHNSSWSRG